MTRSATTIWPDASRGRQGLRRRQMPTRPSRSAWALPVLLLCALLGGAAVLTLLGQARGTAAGTMTSRQLIDSLEEFATGAGLGIDQVEIAGQRFASDSDILDAVDLPNVRTFLSFDGAAIRARIERLAWVDTATIERLVPNRVGIRITERRPFAVWDRGPRDVLIDATGRQLATVGKGQAPDLPRIAGEQAAEDARRLLELVAGYPEVQKRLSRAERIAGRRWRLLLHDGPRIELPADADAAALAMLVEPRPEGRLIDLDAAVIDMTVLRRITFRPAAPPKRGA
jgi:cell division protein FtsQ